MNEIKIDRNKKNDRDKERKKSEKRLKHTDKMVRKGSRMREAIACLRRYICMFIGGYWEGKQYRNKTTRRPNEKSDGKKNFNRQKRIIIS